MIDLSRGMSPAALSTALAVALFSTTMLAMATPAHAQRRGQAGTGRAVTRVAPRAPGRVVATPRVGVPPRVVTVRRPAPFVTYRPYFSQRYYGRPYYSFRPRVGLGLGGFVGYPVSYPRVYGYTYPSSYAYGYAAPYYGYTYAAPSPYPYPYAVASPYPSTYATASPAPYGSVAPGVSALPQTVAPGGVSFEITPEDAAVYIDGAYVGAAGDFSSTSRPLTLTEGRHHIEIRAPGLQSVAFDADVVPGQVIPYQGVLEPAR